MFVGLIPIVLLLALAFLFSYLMLGQLASTYFSSSIRALQGEVAIIDGELAGSLHQGAVPASFAPIADRVLRPHMEKLPHAAARLLKAGVVAPGTPIIVDAKKTRRKSLSVCGSPVIMILKAF